jgi:hypothetical protein
MNELGEESIQLIYLVKVKAEAEIISVEDNKHSEK